MQAARWSGVAGGGRELGLALLTRLDRDRAARMEAAAGRHVDRVRRLAAQDLGTRRAAADPGAGTTESSAFVYGWRGRSMTSRAGPSSTIRPRYMTQIRSAKRAAVERSCVIMSTARPRSRSSSRMREDPGAHGDVEHRDGLVGDEEIGLRATRLAAIATRCRWPPESSCGKRSTKSSAGASPTCSSAWSTALAPLGARADPVDDERLRDGRRHAEARIERLVRILVDDLHPAAQRAQIARARALVTSMPSKRDASRLRRDEPENRLRGRRLAAARLADERDHLAASRR